MPRPHPRQGLRQEGVLDGEETGECLHYALFGGSSRSPSHSRSQDHHPQPTASSLWHQLCSLQPSVNGVTPALPLTARGPPEQQRFCQGRPAWGQPEPQELPSETLLGGLQPPLRHLAMAQGPLNTSVTHPRGLTWGGPQQAPAPVQHGGLPGGRGRSYVCAKLQPQPSTEASLEAEAAAMYVPSSLTAACNTEEKVVSQPSGP